MSWNRVRILVIYYAIYIAWSYLRKRLYSAPTILQTFTRNYGHNTNVKITPHRLTSPATRLFVEQNVCSRKHQRSALLTFCDEKPLVTAGLFAQAASDEESVSITWCFVPMPTPKRQRRVWRERTVGEQGLVPSYRPSFPVQDSHYKDQTVVRWKDDVFEFRWYLAIQGR